MIKNKKGFTLVEMLVVVAVIGILSSVLLTALGPARNKAKDARITQEVNQARAYAETLYNGNYSRLVVIDPPFGGGEDNPQIEDEIIAGLFADIKTNGGRLTIKKVTSAQYIAYSPLNTTVNQEGVQVVQYFCVDSAGKSSYTTDQDALVSQNNQFCP